ncbi:VWA domain-containing protein [Akkermansiaceae bacterium]|nr:VWA domain-containing protein [Akkermansiaceae bacterium]
MNLAHPAWLLLWIAVPAIAVLAVLAGRFAKRPWEEFAAERLRGRLVRREHPLPRWLSLGLLLAASAAMVFTLARPQGDAGTRTETTKGRNIMIALDLSRSMRVQDVKPDRLAQAKIVIYELLDSLKDDRIGLIGFAGSPFLSAPLTIDHSAVKETVEQIDEEWVPKGGSDISAAVQLATQVLKETGQKNNALIVISDGEEHEGDLAAIIAEAERSGVTIFAVGVGTEDGGFVPHPGFVGGLVDSSGNRILSRIQPDVLRKLANGTGGSYVIAGRGADIPAMVKVAIQGIDAFEMEGGRTRIVVEFFQWALFPAIVFLMAAIVAGTRWRGMAGGVSALFFLMTVQPGHADAAKDARKAFAEERFDEARDKYRSLAESKGGGGSSAGYRLGQALSAYAAQDYRGARTAYSEALLAEDWRIAAKAHEGMGNTLFQLGWMGLSGSSYPEGEEVPDMGEFDALVREQLKRMGEAEPPESGETNEFIRLDSIILNWTDAVRHYRSALAKDPGAEGAMRNEELTMNYLKRLRELLEEEKEQTEQEIQQQEQQGQGQGQGEPQEGEGGEGEPKEGGEGEPQQGEGGEEQEDKGKGGEEQDEEGENGKNGDEEKADPNETSEERASRILSENSDVEKGPLTQGRRDFRPPDKDW